MCVRARARARHHMAGRIVSTDFGQLRQPLSCGQGLFKRDDDDDDEYTHLTFRNYKVHIRVYYLELRKEILSIAGKQNTQRHTHTQTETLCITKKIGLVRDLNPGPLAP